MTAIIVRTLEIDGKTYNLVYAGAANPRHAVPVYSSLDKHSYDAHQICACKPIYKDSLTVHQ